MCLSEAKGMDITMIKVLIADDEPLVGPASKTVLPWNMYGFDVIAEAADGKEAYEKLKNSNPIF